MNRRQEPPRSTAPKTLEGPREIQRGKVWLIGAGPGDPELLTVRAHRLLAGAEVVAYDELVAPEVLAIAPATAERIPVGRRARGCRHHEGRIHPLVVERALAGKEVVRVKGGDPLVFGRGGEEAEELAAARIPFEVVPGISAALGAAATALIPLTHRECASSVTLITAHAAEGAPDIAANVTADGTLVFYMGLAKIHETCEGLLASGRAPTTPAAVVARATLPDARVIVATLQDIAAKASEAALAPPALLIVGEVVARRVVRPSPLVVDAAATSDGARATG